MFRSIICPVDIAEPGLETRALAAAKQLAETSGSTLTLLSVVLDSPSLADRYLPPDFKQHQVEAATEALRTLGRGLGLGDGRVHIRVRHGRAYHEILEEANETKADLIVMASHRPALSTYLIGSNASYVVRHATCSVMVIREEA
jgi:nucleotide-binding universal stress UspA family protein